MSRFVSLLCVYGIGVITTDKTTPVAVCRMFDVDTNRCTQTRAGVDDFMRGAEREGGAFCY